MYSIWIDYAGTYQKYRDCEIIFEQEAYERLQNGRFRADCFSDGLSSIVIESVKVEYAADSKGFYQPVYHSADV